jgi:hypothetical protein
MDNNRFDSLTKEVAEAASRRSLLKGVAAGAAGAALALVGVAQGDDLTTEARKRKKRQEKRHTERTNERNKKENRREHKREKAEPECDKDAACPQPSDPCKKRVCQGGRCVTEIRGDGANCGTDQVCSGGQCVATCGGTEICTGELVCEGGACVCPGGGTTCSGTCVQTDTDVNNCGECGRTCSGGDICSNGLACQAATCLPVTGFEDDVSLAEDGGLTATTTGLANQAAIILADIPAGTTFGDLASMQSDFDFTLGHCGAGQPRFVVRLQNGRCPYAAFPPATCNTDGAQGSTGELINNEEPFVWNDNLCGGSGNLTNLYSEVLALYENEPVARIELVVDTSSGENTVTLSPCVTVA